MPYDFDQPIDRRRSDSVKWHHYPDGVLPMWVADMDFASPQAVLRALHERVAQAVFGYPRPSEALLEAVCDRMYRLYGWSISPQHVVVFPGLVTGLNMVCRGLGQPGDGVLMQTPVYHPFLHAPKNHGLIMQDAPLTCVAGSPAIGAGRTFHYQIDFESFENAITGRTRLFLLCNPHNPIGQVYTPGELTRLAEICLRRDLVICSDEIHAELLLGDSRHTPIAALAPEIAERTITLVAPSKTFNLAGLGCGFAISHNLEWLKRLRLASEGIVPLVNAMGLAAALAAYRDDPDVSDWLSSLLQYLTANRDWLVDFILRQLPEIRTTVPQATYLAWLDCREAGSDGSPYEFFLQQANVGLNDGSVFGPNGQGFVRLNFGCPRSTLVQALGRMKAALDSRRGSNS